MKKIIKKAVIQTPTWVFLLLFLTSSIICIFSLRHNNETMVKLRGAVYEADKNNGDVNTALNNLRKYVYAHMNTNLSSGGNAIKPPIQLKYTYERLQSAEQKKAEDANTSIYTQAQVYCQLAGLSLVTSVLLFILFISSLLMDRLVSTKLKNNIG
jgi:cystathionine beta-lyase/cystathionine gamma-synthase